MDRIQAEVLVRDAAAHGLLGPLVLAVSSGDLAIPENVAEDAVTALEGAMLWCMQLELRLLEVADWFDQAGGIEFLVVKGPSVAHLDALDPSLRSFADLDLLIHARDMDRAIAALVAHGVARRIPQRRPGFDRRFTKGVGLCCEDGVEIDVHRTLCVGALGFRMPLDDLFARPDHFEVGGRRFAALGLEHRALHAAYHAVVGSAVPALRTLRDLAGYLTRPELPPAVLVAEAERWGGTTVLAEAVRITFDTLSFDSPAWRDWSACFTPDQSDLKLIERSHTSSPWPVEWTVLRELTWCDRAAFTYAVTFPSREVLNNRGVTRSERVWLGARRLLRK